MGETTSMTIIAIAPVLPQMYRKPEMIERECAVEIQHYALQAIADLMRLLHQSHGHCSPESYEAIKEGVGRSIGSIQMGILELVIAEFPELDDIKE
jgi:hypothetical protein